VKGRAVRIKLSILVVTAALSALAAAGSLATASRGATPPANLGLQQALDALVAAGGPGALVLVRDGNRTIRLTSGLGNLARRTPMRSSDRFRIGSVTKTFVATVVLQLVGERKLSLDDTVERLLPGLVPGGGAITLRQLLNHTAGLFDYLEDGDPTALEPYRQGKVAYRWTPRQLVAIATAHKPHFAPGTSYTYCNTCYVLLGLIVQAATGNSIGAELRQRIFTPLRLDETSFDSEPRIARAHAHGYLLLGKRRLGDVSVISPSFAWAAGAIVSTGDDLARFYRALLGGRLLRPDLLRAMETTVAFGPGPRHGLGLLAPRLSCGLAWGHDGEFPGYTTVALNSKDGKRQIVLFVNLERTSFSKPVDRAFERLIQTAFCG
jgi:D-alanyl-D-alanine carboxypeptidase